MPCSLITSSQMSQIHLACVVRDWHMCHYCLAERWSVPLMRGFFCRRVVALSVECRHSGFCRRRSSAPNQQLIKAFWSDGPRMIAYHQILIDIGFCVVADMLWGGTISLEHERILKKSMLFLCLCFHLVWEFVKRQDCLSFPHRLHYLQRCINIISLFVALHSNYKPLRCCWCSP